MDYSLLLHPLVGSVIGYITNWIAVKMLFKPSKAIYIGKYKLPFTPGIIPRNQNRLAIGISNTIANSLLNEDVLKENLLSDDIKDQINESIENFLNSEETTPVSLIDLINKTEHSDTLNQTVVNLVNTITTSILTTIKEANLSSVISTEIEKSVDDYMEKNVLTRLAKKPILSSLNENLEPQINNYIETNGEKLIHDMVEKEITKYLNTSSLDLKDFIRNSNIDINSIILSIYSSIISSKLSSILDTINITKVVENKINSMDSKEIEVLVLSIISKELNALVSLGAIIGFVLGLGNIFIK
jgi:uncharacterized membrane protein YheB (UPF0754 family)